MTISIKKSGAWKLATAISIRKAGAWKLVSGIAIKKDGVWKTAYGALTVPGTPDLSATISASTITASRAGNGVVSTANITVTPADGVPPYTYTWSKVSGVSNFTRNGGATAVVNWEATFSDAPSSYTEVWKCVVGDAAAGSVEVSVSVTLFTTASSVLTVNYSVGASLPYGPGDAYLQTQWFGTVSGGNGSYSYTWTSNFGVTPGVFGDASKCYVNDTDGGGHTGTLTLSVTDTSGKSGSKTGTVSF